MNVQSHCEAQAVAQERYSLLYGGNVLRFKLPFGEELGSDSPLKKQPLLGHLHQDEPHQLPHVHPTDHLLKPAEGDSSSHARSMGKQRKQSSQITASLTAASQD